MPIRAGAEVPRRICTDLYTPMEKAIADAARLIEEGPPSVHLTDAVILLGKAREKVADFVDGVPVAPVPAEDTFTEAEGHFLLGTPLGEACSGEAMIEHDRIADKVLRAARSAAPGGHG